MYKRLKILLAWNVKSMFFDTNIIFIDIINIRAIVRLVVVVVVGRLFWIFLLLNILLCSDLNQWQIYPFYLALFLLLRLTFQSDSQSAILLLFERAFFSSLFALFSYSGSMKWSLIMLEICTWLHTSKMHGYIDITTLTQRIVVYSILFHLFI